MRLLHTLAVAGMWFLVAAAAPGGAIAQVPHTVEPGESLWSIAVEDGLGVEELAAANGLSVDAQLVAGQTVLIPPQAPGTPTASAGTGQGRCVWDCASPVHPHPTAETVAPGQVASIGAHHAMSGPVVQAIAATESGFDNSLVSSAGARGVMQIMPATWEFIEENLVETPLDPASASDNVAAGVIYLHHLYHLMGENGDSAIAAYYQGPNRDELLPETQQYLSTVRTSQASWAAGAP